VPAVFHPNTPPTAANAEVREAHAVTAESAFRSCRRTMSRSGAKSPATLPLADRGYDGRAMKTILITGGGRGLGRATAERLAAAGHRVLLTARTPSAAETAATEIRRRHPAAIVEPRPVDLASLAAVRAFASAQLEADPRIDVLFHVAGVMQQSPTRRVTVDGFEETLAVNVLAPFLLTGLLLPALERSTAARIVFVSSRLHLPGSRGVPVDFDFDDPQLERGYHPERAYKNSKLADLWLAYELQRRLPPRPITSNAVCPGFVPVTASASAHGVKRRFMRVVLPHMPFATSVDAAADAFAFMAVDPSIEAVGGQFFGERRPIDSSPESHDVGKARRFWELAADLTGCDPLPRPPSTNPAAAGR
jgi:NAD(P)-dependent dehydrogenase (short-subunit alcohol dehydrogenase family)